MSPGQKVSLNLSIDRDWQSEFTPRELQPGKNAQLLLVWLCSRLSFTTIRTTESTDRISLSSMMLFYMCGIILILSVKEAVDSLRLHGGVSVARNDGGRKLYWSQGRTLRGSADNLHIKYTPELFYLCISFIFQKKCKIDLYPFYWMPLKGKTA